MQLALYRMAYSEMFGVDEERIAVCLYYVGQNEIVRPKNVLTKAQLKAKWNELLKTFSDGHLDREQKKIEATS